MAAATEQSVNMFSKFGDKYPKSFIEAVNYSLRRCNLGFTLKDQQMAAIYSFVSGSDVFVNLQTSYGKSLCFTLLPFIFDFFEHPDENSSSLIVVSPLLSLMEDQQIQYESYGIKCVKLSSVNLNEHVNAQIYLASPEVLENTKVKLFLRSKRSNIVGIAVDEAHCVEQWFVAYNFILYMFVIC